jgi:hypothetical protein
LIVFGYYPRRLHYASLCKLCSVAGNAGTKWVCIPLYCKEYTLLIISSNILHSILIRRLFKNFNFCWIPKYTRTVRNQRQALQKIVFTYCCIRLSKYP